MELTVGKLVEGKVKTITKFGAFLLLPEGRTGMIHISEISDRFVSDIHAHLAEGQIVCVKVLGIDETGKISLSLKRAKELPASAREAAERTPPIAAKAMTFEDKLRQFLSDSDSKISGSRQYEHKTKTRKR